MREQSTNKNKLSSGRLNLGGFKVTKPSGVHYDEAKGQWVNIGGTVSGNTITVTVDDFTRYAVMVEKTASPPAQKPPVTLTDISGHWAGGNIKAPVLLQCRASQVFFKEAGVLVAVGYRTKLLKKIAFDKKSVIRYMYIHNDKSGVVMITSEMIDKNSIIPIYYQLYKYYEKRISDGVLKPGDALPTEMEIADNLGISRMTVRRAIAELANAGMIYTQKGKGTFVAKPKLDNVVFDLRNYFDEIRQKGLNPHTKLLEAKIVKADDMLAKRMRVEVNTRCLFFRIVITADGEPLAYEAKYTVYSKRRPTLETELKDPSLSNLAAVHSDSVPASSKKVLMVSKAINEEPAILGVAPGSPVFLMLQTIYDADNKIIAWGKSIFRGDRYKLVSYDGWNIEGIKDED